MPVLLTGELLEGLVAVPVGGGRARAGLEIDHSEPSGSRVAISRAAGASGAWKTRGARSNMRHHAGPPHTGTSSSPSSASSVGGRQIQGFDGRLEGGGCFLVLV